MEEKNTYNSEIVQEFSIEIVVKSISIILVVVINCIGLYIYDYKNDFSWWVLNIIDSFSRIAIPLFLSLLGAIFLAYSNGESISDFYKNTVSKTLLVLLFSSLFFYFYKIDFIISVFDFRQFVQGLFEGSIYFHLSFFYYLLGIFFIIPLLSVFVRSIKKIELELFFFIWLISEIAIFSLNTLNFSVSSDLFQIVGIIGYPIIGYYVSKYGSLSKRKLQLFLTGWLFTILITFYLSDKSKILNETFYQYQAPNVIIMAYIAFTWILKFDWQKIFDHFNKIKKLFFITSKLYFFIFLINPIILHFLFQKIHPNLIKNPIMDFLVLFIMVFCISWIISFLFEKMIRFLGMIFQKKIM